MAQTSDVLLLSGLPGSGKTRYTRWLERVGWTCLRVDDQHTWDLSTKIAFSNALQGADDGLLAIVAASPGGFVLEWGFPVAHLPTIEAMLGRGYNAWYFDGHGESALSAWLQARPNASQAAVATCREQIASLQSCADTIRRLYGSRILYTVKPDGKRVRHMPERKIHRHLGLVNGPPSSHE